MNLVNIINEIELIDKEISIRNDEISNLLLRKEKLTEKLQNNCTHPESLHRKTSESFEDEYGVRWGTKYKIHCYVCGKILEEYNRYTGGRIEEIKID